jgi:hypothetical protein
VKFCAFCHMKNGLTVLFCERYGPGWKSNYAINAEGGTIVVRGAALTVSRMTKRLWSQISMSRPFRICIAVATTSWSSAANIAKLPELLRK